LPPNGRTNLTNIHWLSQLNCTDIYSALYLFYTSLYSALPLFSRRQRLSWKFEIRYWARFFSILCPLIFSFWSVFLQKKCCCRCCCCCFNECDFQEMIKTKNYHQKEVRFDYFLVKYRKGLILSELLLNNKILSILESESSFSYSNYSDFISYLNFSCSNLQTSVHPCTSLLSKRLYSLNVVLIEYKRNFHFPFKSWPSVENYLSLKTWLYCQLSRDYVAEKRMHYNVSDLT
jgi:hypothetical protein